MQFTHANGTPVAPGEVVTPDNQVQTFTVQLRSLSGIGYNDLKDLLQTKYEVTNIEQTGNVVVVA